jgi:hypothetical protein
VVQLQVAEGGADLVCVGKVLYRIDHECVVVVQAEHTLNPLNESSILCNKDGKVC